MAQQSFSDISSSSFHNADFDCERALFTDPPALQSPSLSYTQKLASANVETNCSNKSDAIIQGSFIKGLERFERQISYEESVFDIYGLKEVGHVRQKQEPFRSDKELMEKYVMKFEKSKAPKKSHSKGKTSALTSVVSVKRIDTAISSTNIPPRDDYYTLRNTAASNKNPKLKTQRSQKSKSVKKSEPKPLQGTKSKSKSKISLGKSKLIEKEKTKSIIPFK